ncbi:MAG: DNA mismatch repair endonuclease MutL [Pseudarcicella sp.]|nr:DNA mismatch repair endonuclease MutL [Pseudarcicella sp.]MBP6409842.1 DNA mismatch repair endonuclease MutL [Pseudarcicella sp.]
MLDVIKLLPDAIANQIAAGEVVQRPASVVKELLENAIDAKATNIQLIIKEAGKTLIQSIDNGIGMSETDARMCFERHATSKIRNSEDLFKIKTMGFRGEAMASIAAVAQVEMRTRRQDDELGVLLKIEASDFKQHEPTSTPVGTNIQVKNLFFNVPARRNFLKSNPVEMKHILDEFERVALANPNIGFSFYHNNEEVYNLPAETLPKRIVDLFGKNYKEQLANCHEETSFLSVKGFIGKPEFAKKTRGEQFFFVNNRFIKSSYLNHAVTAAFQGLISDGAFPFYVLFLEIDPIHVDVNVHPTKTEIKFDDEKTVYAIVHSAVKKAMSMHNLLPRLDFDSDINFNNRLDLSTFSPPNKSESQTLGSSIRSNHPASSAKTNLSNWNKLYDGLSSSINNFENTNNQEISQQAIEYVEDIENVNFTKTTNTPNNSFSKIDKTENSVETNTFQLHQRYIVAQVKSGMLIIDQKVAYERIVFEKYFLNLEKRNGVSQQLLFPKTIQLSPANATLLLEMIEEIKNLGFGITPSGGGNFVLNGLPVDLASHDEKSIIEDLLEQYTYNETNLQLDRFQNLARTLAKRYASKYDKHTLNQLEMNALVEQLFSTSNPSYSPSGEPTMKILSLEEITGIFNQQ